MIRREAVLLRVVGVKIYPLQASTAVRHLRPILAVHKCVKKKSFCRISTEALKLWKMGYLLGRFLAGFCRTFGDSSNRRTLLSLIFIILPIARIDIPPCFSLRTASRSIRSRGRPAHLIFPFRVG